VNEIAPLADASANRPTLGGALAGLPPIAGPAKPEAAEALLQCAAAVDKGAIVAVGKLPDLFLLALCAGAQAGSTSQVHVAGPGKGKSGGAFARFSRPDLAHLLHRVPRTGAEDWSEPVSLLVFAGAEAESPAPDFAAWLQRLAPAATVVFDRPGLPGSKQAIKRLVKSGALQPLERKGRLAIFRAGDAAPKPDGRAAARLAKRRTARATRRDADRRQSVAEMSAETFVVPWRMIGHSVYYGGDGAYLYQPIPKCACTTIKTLLLEYEGLAVDENPWRRHSKRFNNFPGLTELGEEQQRDIYEGRTRTFKFVIVRNPYRRLASVYSDKVVRRAAFVMRKLANAARRQGIELSDPVSFEQFVDLVCRQGIKEMDAHWRPQYVTGRFATIHYDFVGRVENMPEDLVYALDRIGAPAAIVDRANQRYNETGSDISIWKTVSPELRERFVERFAIDFDTLGYPRELPC
jgi:Sulfotransferase family